jgi:hypothetical protein
MVQEENLNVRIHLYSSSRRVFMHFSERSVLFLCVPLCTFGIPFAFWGTVRIFTEFFKKEIDKVRKFDIINAEHRL